MTQGKTTKVTVMVLKDTYGFVSADVKPVKNMGYFFHKSQMLGMGFHELEVGKTVEVDGQLVEEPGPDGKMRREVQGNIMPVGTGAAREKQNEVARQAELDRKAVSERAQRMFAFHREYQGKFPKRDHPVKELFAVYEAGGWAALDSLHAKLDAEKEARMPPPRGPYTKAPIKQL